LPPVAALYPGWLFVDGTTGVVGQSVTVGSQRAHQLQIEIKAVTRTGGAKDRLSIIAECLAEVAEGDGGCILVCCNTVAEAQHTFQHLQTALNTNDGEPVEVRLLHSRLQAQHRKTVTEQVQSAFGKPGNGGNRPTRAVLVATQVVEQSIDLDFDLVVSDLAPIALLLQRAGRCQRHQRDQRPAWIGSQPRLVVLDPVKGNDEYELPKPWGSVYYDSLLRHTRQLLRDREGTAIAVPKDVQALVDGVYGDVFAQVANVTEKAGLDQWKADVEYAGAVLAEKQLAGNIIINEPEPNPTNLYSELWKTRDELDDDLIVTRLGADSARVLLGYHQAGGDHSLDPSGKIALRQPLTAAGVRTLMEHTIPVPGSWVRSHPCAVKCSPAWERNSLLRELVVIEGRATADEGWRADDGSLHYEATSGLRRDRDL